MHMAAFQVGVDGMPARPRSASPVVSAEVRVLAEGCGNHLASAARRLVDRRRLEHRGVHERVRLQDLQLSKYRMRDHQVQPCYRVCVRWPFEFVWG